MTSNLLESSPLIPDKTTPNVPILSGSTDTSSVMASNISKGLSVPATVTASSEEPATSTQDEPVEKNCQRKPCGAHRKD